MTTVGPLELSGFAAGVSVEGPMASVSVRFSSVRAAGWADVGTAGCVLSAEAGSTWPVGDASVGWAVVVVVAVPRAVAASVVGAAAAAAAVVVVVVVVVAVSVWRVRISRGAADRASWAGPWRSAGVVE